MTDVVVGIDPGLSGGVAVMTLSGDVVEARAMPTRKAEKGRTVDALTLSRLLSAPDRRVKQVVIERVHAMRGQGVCAIFTFGMGYGVVLGVVGALDLPAVLVLPKEWQKHVIRTGAAGDTKALSVAYCTAHHPALSLKATPRSRTASDGISDAVAISEYARRLALGR